MIVVKFGGTSVGKPERMKKIAELVLGTPGKKIVVLSALSGTTNTLVAIGDHLLVGQNLSQDLGIFFSIYYCMTGLHAFHVIGGMVALSWLLYRSIYGHWRADYYGPVDYVGLYWHLVDLIWIFLFPLLYLIN